jgi:hypothetical protein
MHSRVRVGCVTLVGVSNGTVQTVTVGNEEQANKDDHSIELSQLTVDCFDSTNTGSGQQVFTCRCVVVVESSIGDGVLLRVIKDVVVVCRCCRGCLLGRRDIIGRVGDVGVLLDGFRHCR